MRHHHHLDDSGPRDERRGPRGAGRPDDHPALALGLVETFGAGYLPILTHGVIGPEYKDIFAFAILIVILVFRPMGILGERVTR